RVLFRSCLGGCASRPEAAAADRSEALLGLSPDGAYYRDGQLLLQYSIAEDWAYLGASWPVDDLSPNQHNYRMAVIDLAAEKPASPAELQRDWQPVRLFENEHWKALVNTLLEDLVPDTTATGTLVTVQ